MKAEEVVAIRTRLGMDQKTFAKLLNVVDRTISRWETGAAEPGPSAEAALAGFTEVLNRSDEPRQKEIIEFIRNCTPIGGISYILLRLFEMMLMNKKLTDNESSVTSTEIKQEASDAFRSQSVREVEGSQSPGRIG